MIDLSWIKINIYGIIITIMAAWFFISLWRLEKTHDLDWVDMITRDGKKISATKVLQLVGGFVGTFIIIKVTLQGNLTWDLFAIYLAYVASIDGFSKFMIAKYGGESSKHYDDTYYYRRNNNWKNRKNNNFEEDADFIENVQENLYNGGKRTDMMDF